MNLHRLVVVYDSAGLVHNTQPSQFEPNDYDPPNNTGLQGIAVGYEMEIGG
eukprot:CAMPEP_0171322914 /NCGR_PEP_ID=MMETSP0816-20121228/115251_1 /TAXON_ID=420281 /ORGANISM="Proboscia inermis, Strain CCAP1064/1" /LENGTH=50 /DNA_ID=CAMNT_0011821495 /DNA_START=136 /DNA_END=288 /DNA_ORIENTATION=-